MNAISPTTEEPTPPAEDIPQAIAPSAEACQIYQDLTARGIRFVLAGEKVKMLRTSEDVALPDAEEHAQLRRLKPEIARDVCRSRISQAAVQSAFEIASGPSIYHRLNQAGSIGWGGPSAPSGLWRRCS